MSISNQPVMLHIVDEFLKKVSYVFLEDYFADKENNPAEIFETLKLFLDETKKSAILNTWNGLADRQKKDQK